VARFYRNENFPLPTVNALRALGHDVLTIMETGRADQAWPDDQVLAFAHAEKRILLTFNRKHFKRLHAQGHPHHGMVLCTVDVDFARQAQRIHEAISARETLLQQIISVTSSPGSMSPPTS